MVSAKKKALGKGLSALIGGQPKKTASADMPPAVSVSADAVHDSEQILYLDPRIIQPNPRQPRTCFDEESLHELSESIKRDGVQEPVIVRRKNDEYQLVSGERRVRASIMADLESIPAVCRHVSDSDMLRLGLIENIQRENLNAIELANAYQELIDEFSWTQEELAQQVGKNRVTVANTLRLLKLPLNVQGLVRDESITMGHARALLALESPESQSMACKKVINKGLSVRQTEKLVTDFGKQKEPPQKPGTDPDIRNIEDELRRRLGVKVSVHSMSGDKGRIVIEYYTLDDFERILDIVRKKA